MKGGMSSRIWTRHGGGTSFWYADHVTGPLSPLTTYRKSLTVVRCLANVTIHFCEYGKRRLAVFCRTAHGLIVRPGEPVCESICPLSFC